MSQPTKPIITSQINSPEFLADLDDLLAESTAIATAKKLKSQGKKLAPTDTAALELARLMEEVEAWQPVAAIAHFIHSHCACGAQSARFNGWYKTMSHRKQASARLLHSDHHDGLPTFQHSTLEQVASCHECLAVSLLQPIDPSDFPLLAHLGQPLPVNTAQLQIDLLIGESVSDELLGAIDGPLIHVGAVDETGS